MTYVFIIQYQKTNILGTIFEPLMTSLKNDVILQKYDPDVSVMVSSNQNLLNTNLHAKIGAFMNFGNRKV